MKRLTILYALVALALPTQIVAQSNTPAAQQTIAASPASADQTRSLQSIIADISDKNYICKDWRPVVLEIEKLIATDTNLTQTGGKNNDTILHIAAASANTKIITDIIQKSPGLKDSVNSLGNTPLHVILTHAIGPNKAAIARKLLTEKAINKPNDVGKTPFYIAIERRMSAFIRHVLEESNIRIDFTITAVSGKNYLALARDIASKSEEYRGKEIVKLIEEAQKKAAISPTERLDNLAAAASSSASASSSSSSARLTPSPIRTSPQRLGATVQPQASPPALTHRISPPSGLSVRPFALPLRIQTSPISTPRLHPSPTAIPVTPLQSPPSTSLNNGQTPSVSGMRPTLSPAHASSTATSRQLSPMGGGAMLSPASSARMQLNASGMHSPYCPPLFGPVPVSRNRSAPMTGRPFAAVLPASALLTLNQPSTARAKSSGAVDSAAVRATPPAATASASSSSITPTLPLVTQPQTGSAAISGSEASSATSSGSANSAARVDSDADKKRKVIAAAEQEATDPEHAAKKRRLDVNTPVISPATKTLKAFIKFIEISHQAGNKINWTSVERQANFYIEKGADQIIARAFMANITLFSSPGVSSSSSSQKPSVTDILKAFIAYIEAGIEAKDSINWKSVKVQINAYTTKGADKKIAAEFMEKIEPAPASSSTPVASNSESPTPASQVVAGNSKLVSPSGKFAVSARDGQDEESADAAVSLASKQRPVGLAAVAASVLLSGSTAGEAARVAENNATEDCVEVATHLLRTVITEGKSCSKQKRRESLADILALSPNLLATAGDYNSTILHILAQDGDLAAIQDLQKHDPTSFVQLLKIKDVHGKSPFALAWKKPENHDLITWLLPYIELSPNQCDESNETLLMAAAARAEDPAWESILNTLHESGKFTHDQPKLVAVLVKAMAKDRSRITKLLNMWLLKKLHNK